MKKYTPGTATLMYQDWTIKHWSLKSAKSMQNILIQQKEYYPKNYNIASFGDTTMCVIYWRNRFEHHDALQLFLTNHLLEIFTTLGITTEFYHAINLTQESTQVSFRILITDDKTIVF